MSRLLGDVPPGAAIDRFRKSRNCDAELSGDFGENGTIRYSLPRITDFFISKFRFPISFAATFRVMPEHVLHVNLVC